MKITYRFFLPLIFILLSICSKSQKSPAKYTDFDRGYNNFYYKKWDSAFLMFNRYVNAPDDTLKKGAAYSYMGEIQWKIGDLYGAQESLTSAINILDPQNMLYHEELGYTYNLLGNVSLDLKRYNEAINFYNQAIIYFKGKDYSLEIMNGKAVAFQKKGDFKKAILIYDSMLAFKPANQQLIARLIDNRARTKWLQNNSYPALEEFWQALKIRSDGQYNDGLVTSYAHLSDFYAKPDADSALWYANKMLEKATTIQNPDDVLEAIDKLIRLNTAPAVKEKWYDAFIKLNDSIQQSRDTTRNRFALIRYDVQKSKADNLVLQQDISRQRLMIYILTATAIVIIIGLSSWFHIRRNRIKQESENSIRNSKLKLSQKIHDVVANGLYGIMNELEHNNTFDREPLIDKIEALYEKSRNISYEDNLVNNNKDYDKEIPQLLNSFANEKTNVIILGDQQIFWSKVGATQKHELYLVLNEIMINMQKHSQAKNVVIRFKEENNKCIISYKDDGTGLSPGLKFGNGLKNTVNRIKSINGEINFEKAESGGTLIAISFPL